MPGRPLHVLLIDPSVGGAEAATDNPRRFRRLVPAHGCRVDGVTDLAQALDAVRDHSYDAVVLDAGHDAAHMLRRLRSMAADAALLVLRSSLSSAVPLNPQDVGDQSTLDLDDLDERTMSLTLHLAVERHRVSRLIAQASSAHVQRPASLRDPLTGLVMGERLLEDIDRMIADAVRFRRPLTVAVVQIDTVDQVRAELGSAGLDCVQAQVAGLILGDLRDCDLAGRLGDGQFVIVMASTPVSGAALPLARLQAAVAAATPVIPLARTPLTVSVGVSRLQGLMAVDEMVHAALTAAHQASSDGRSGMLVAERRLDDRRLDDAGLV